MPPMPSPPPLHAPLHANSLPGSSKNPSLITGPVLPKALLNLMVIHVSVYIQWPHTLGKSGEYTLFKRSMLTSPKTRQTGSRCLLTVMHEASLAQYSCQKIWSYWTGSIRPNQSGLHSKSVKVLKDKEVSRLKATRETCQVNRIQDPGSGKRDAIKWQKWDYWQNLHMVSLSVTVFSPRYISWI